MTVATVIAQVPGLQGPPGSGGSGDGEPGDDGWSPVFAVVMDGARRVLKVVDWVGGEGTKPAVDKYVGASGLVDAIGDGVDIRGAQGAPGASGDGTGDVVGPDGDVTDGHAAVFDGTSGKVIKSAGAPPFDGDYDSLSNTPTLGAASALNVGTTAGTVAAGDHDHDGVYDPDGAAAAIGSALASHAADTNNPHAVTKTQVGLGSVSNDAQLPLAGGTMTGNIAFSGTQTVDGRDVSADGTKLDGIETGADVTDATNVAAAGALMAANNLSDLADPLLARANLKLVVIEESDYEALDPPDAATIYYVVEDS